MTLAVIKTGGKQYLVSEGDILEIEKIEGIQLGDASGSESEGKVKFDEVLMVDDGKATKVGTPLVEQASVEGEIIEQFKDKKIRVFKMKRRKRYRRTQGHRQQVTKVKINKINA